eukprot:UN15447
MVFVTSLICMQASKEGKMLKMLVLYAYDFCTGCVGLLGYMYTKYET